MINFEQAEKISLLLRSKTGIVIGSDRYDVVCNAVKEAMENANQSSFDQYFQSISLALPIDPKLQILIEKLTISETFFFRDEAQFNALRNTIFPSLIEQNALNSRTLNILSAGCASGEEPYSLAIILKELLPQKENWSTNIIGIDINLATLARARKAIYGKWSFRGVDPYYLQTYFHTIEQGYQLNESIKAMVKFQFLNLVEGLPFIGLDLILWRNVSIYFLPEMMQKIADECYQALTEGGWLIVGTCEFSQQYFSKFEAVSIGDTVVYRKPINETNKNNNIFEFSSESSPLNLENNIENVDSFISWPDAVLFNRDSLEKINALLNRPLDDRAPVKEVPLSLSLYQQAKLKADNGEMLEAKQYCHQYLQHVPTSVEGYYLLALICEAINKENEAVEALKRALFLDRNFVMGHWHLALLYRKLNLMSEVRRHLVVLNKLLTSLSDYMEIPYSEGQTVARLLQMTKQLMLGVVNSL